LGRNYSERKYAIMKKMRNSIPPQSMVVPTSSLSEDIVKLTKAIFTLKEKCAK